MKLLTDIDYLAKYKDSFLTVLIEYTPRLISALIVLFVGIWVIRLINKVLRKIMIRRHVEPTLIEFLSDIIFWGLRIMLFITFITKLGVESSSFVAILGAAGLAVGLSLQGSLSNFAGGMLIILFKPFKLNDTIEAQGVSGTVTDIQIFVTKLLTANNQVIFIPNGALSNGNIINYSQQENRRTDLTISLSYDTNSKEARTIIMEVIKNDPNILTEPKPSVTVKGISESAIHIAIRVWTKNDCFWEVSSDLLENCKIAFDEKNIHFQPFVVEKSRL